VGDVFFELGRRTGRGLRRGRWLLEAFAGPSEDAIAAEYASGCDLARSFEQSIELDTDARRTTQLDRLASRMIGRLRNRQRRWRVAGLRDPEPGAFALPGGFVYLSSGLLELCDANDHEIAWVIGHEMGHIVHGHTAARIAGEWLGSAAAQVAAGGSGALGRWVLANGARAVTRAYSREQELEADRFGARLALAAGFAPDAALRVCTRLQEFEAHSDQPLAEYFATHPPLAQRAEALRRWLAEERAEG
jgi:Zn-dependent protease with chaperone function